MQSMRLTRPESRLVEIKTRSIKLNMADIIRASG
jgi:hypothetical protein